MSAFYAFTYFAGTDSSEHAKTGSAKIYLRRKHRTSVFFMRHHYQSDGNAT